MMTTRNVNLTRAHRDEHLDTTMVCRVRRQASLYYLLVEPRLEANRANWNERVAVHTRSRFYDVEGWLRDAPGPPSREIETLGDVKGKTLLHLQCHFGMDTLSWARVGATVTGLDFSPAAITEATTLAKRAGLSERATFVCANVYEASQAVSGRRFDIVYVSLGSLGWLPNVAAWADVVAKRLVPGGQLYLHDVHPFSSCFDDEGDRVIFGYFEEPDSPFVFDSAATYTDGGPLTTTRTYEWNHSIAELVTALRNSGLKLDSLQEHDWTVFQQFPWLEETVSGHFVIPEGRPRIPLTFSLLGHAPTFGSRPTEQ
jgi:2-polyprenyl-3-methyl-5-hydroxy-6-metoxy-1,4-benzoquinol methylase